MLFPLVLLVAVVAVLEVGRGIEEEEVLSGGELEDDWDGGDDSCCKVVNTFAACILRREYQPSLVSYIIYAESREGMSKCIGCCTIATIASTKCVCGLTYTTQEEGSAQAHCTGCLELFQGYSKPMVTSVVLVLLLPPVLGRSERETISTRNKLSTYFYYRNDE